MYDDISDLFHRNKDPGYFCRAAIQDNAAALAASKLWIVPDCRRKTDFRYFETNFPAPGLCRRVKIVASDRSRAERGFVFQDGVDNAESECNLDDIPDEEFAHILENDNDKDKKTAPECLLRPLIDGEELAGFRKYLEENGLKP